MPPKPPITSDSPKFVLKCRNFKCWTLFIVTFVTAFLAYFFQFLFDLYMILAIRQGSTLHRTVFRTYAFGWGEILILMYVVTLLVVVVSVL